jgi:hypothetical protein
MSIREAILKAAHHVEMNPRDWDFYAGVPSGCGTPGCAVGWVAFFLGHRADENVFSLCKKLFGVTHLEWWVRVMPKDTPKRIELTGPELAIKMRAYADKYYPDAIPQNVRAIFEAKQTELAS